MMESRSNRRAVIGSAALLATSATLLGARSPATASSLTGQSTSSVGEATVPSWVFTVLQFQDPYAGVLLDPKDPEPGLTYVGAEVTIHNASDAPLDLNEDRIRLIDVEGIEYSMEGVLGSEPRLRGFNMLPGELARGWVWFALPESAEPSVLVYTPPSPRLAVPVGG